MTTYLVERAEQDIRTLGVNEYRQFVFNFTGQIEAADTIDDVTGVDGQGKTLGVIEDSGTLAIGTVTIATNAITVDKRSVAANKAVTAFIGAANATVGTTYTVRCRAVTGTLQTVEVVGYIRVE